MFSRYLFIFSIVLSVSYTSCRPENEAKSTLTANTKIKGKSVNLTEYKNKYEHISEEEASAAFYYTDEGYLKINPALRENDAKGIDRLSKTILNLSSLVNKEREKGKKCTFYRFIDGSPELLDQVKTKGQIFVERGFFSTSLDKSPDDEGHFSNKDYVMIGTAKHCADISAYSRFEAESEVLFPPGTEFEVTKDMKDKTIYLKVLD